jgi:hypothetical protein
MRERPLEKKMIDALLKRKQAYEKYFRSKEKKKGKGNPEAMDNQAQNAYTSLVKTIFDLHQKSGGAGKDPLELQRLSDEMLEVEFGIKRDEETR